MFKQLQKTKEPENLQKAYDYAVFLLSLKLRTMGEVLKKLQARGFNNVVVDEVINKLLAQKYLDDENYAEIFLENLKNYRNFGFYGIKKKLLEKNLPAKLIERLMQENFSIEEEIKIGQRLLAKEGFKIKKFDNELVYSRERFQTVPYNTNNKQQNQKNKLANKLKSRGFRGEVIAKLIF